MSAYMVDRQHIAYLLDAAMGGAPHRSGLKWWHNGEWHELNRGDNARAAEVGQMLWDENQRSIEARYPGSFDDGTGAPGPIGEDYVYGQHRRQEWVGGAQGMNTIGALGCFAYQACEHDGWPDSEAFAFCEALKSKAIRQLPGYEDAPWGAPKTCNEARAELRRAL